jgi:hypothetical protein
LQNYTYRGPCIRNTQGGRVPLELITIGGRGYKSDYKIHSVPNSGSFPTTILAKQQAESTKQQTESKGCIEERASALRKLNPDSRGRHPLHLSLDQHECLRRIQLELVDTTRRVVLKPSRCPFSLRARREVLWEATRRAVFKPSRHLPFQSWRDIRFRDYVRDRRAARFGSVRIPQRSLSFTLVRLGFSGASTRDRRCY